MKEKLLVSISGGRTSALMSYLIKLRYSDKYDVIFVFANTSREKEETLVFLDQCDKFFGLNVVWVEAVVHYGTRKGCTHSITNFQDAKRKGEVFEAVIKKYGIPNTMFKHCTRELKRNPIRSYAKSLGWTKYKTAIGYRADEPKRVSWEKAKKLNQWYLLAEIGIKKSDVAVFWKQQPFDLQLKDYEGNCKLCYKKSERKLLTQIKEYPEDVDWIKDMEKKYDQVKPKKKAGDKTPVRFFRHNEAVDELVERSKEPFALSVDQSTLTAGAEYDFELDYQEGCEESCEPF